MSDAGAEKSSGQRQTAFLSWAVPAIRNKSIAVALSVQPELYLMTGCRHRETRRSGLYGIQSISILSKAMGLVAAAWGLPGLPRIPTKKRVSTRRSGTREDFL